MTHVVHVVARLNVGGPAPILGALQHGGGTSRHTVLAGRLGAGERSWADVRDGGPRAALVRGLIPAVNPAADAVAIADLTRLLRALRPDVVHTHTAKGGLVGRIAAGLVGIPTVHTFHGHVLTGYFGPRTVAAYTAIERRLAVRTRLLLTVGTRVAEQLLAAGVGRPEQYRTVMPAVPPLVAPSQATARAQLGLDADAEVLVILGRLTGVKRVDRAIDVVARLRADGRRTQLVVAGGGDSEAELRQQAAPLGDAVRFLGWVGDVAEVLAAADLILVTSDNEGMPVGLIEAASVGVPAVATDVGSVAEVVDDGVTGLVVPPDVDALAAACASLLDDPDRRAAMGTAARQHAATRFSTDRLVASHDAIYAEALQPVRGT